MKTHCGFSLLPVRFTRYPLCFFFLLGTLFFLPFASHSQNPTGTSQEPTNRDSACITYAHQIIDSLCSTRMHGRGYVNEGDRIAAAFLKQQFENLKLKSLKSGNSEADYFQNFSFPVNTFPSIVRVKIGEKELIPGKEFLVRADCPSIKGQYELEDSISYLKGKISKKNFYLLKDQKENSSVPAGLIFIKKKLIWDASTQAASFCRIEILDSALSSIQGLNSKGSSPTSSPSKISLEIQNRFIPNHKTQNVIAYIKGTVHPDSFIVFTAHYDHLGQMGDRVYFPGANDNASGCALLLCLARHYASHPPACSITFIAFAGEEAGLLGSQYFVEHPLFQLSRIKFLINLDLLGTGDEGICVVNSTIFPHQFSLLTSINGRKHYLSYIKPRGKAAISDHYFFTENGVKSFYIYTLGGIKAYHDIYDIPQTLPLTKFTQVYNLLKDFTEELSK